MINEFPSWEIFKSWDIPDQATAVEYTWKDFNDLKPLLEEAVETKIVELPTLLAWWDEKLRALDGDPSRKDWIKFRPMSLTREENWSDWLAHLIEFSNSTVLVENLLNENQKKRSVRREVPAEDRRADIVIAWENGNYTQIEIKIDDRDIDKTYDTARKLRKISPANWTDFIIIRSENESSWQDCKRKMENESEFQNINIKHITWEQVDMALRKALVSSSESMFWQAWAYSLVGLIEQKILDIPISVTIPEKADFLKTFQFVRLIDILKASKGQVNG